MKYFLILLFSISVHAQTLLTETYSNYFDPADTVGSVGFWVLNKDWRTTYGGENDSLHEDLSNFGNDLTWNGWASYAAVADSANKQGSAYNSTTALRFDRSSKMFLYTSSAPSVTRGTGNWTILFVWNSEIIGGRKALGGFGNHSTQDRGTYSYAASTNTFDFDLTARAGPNGTTNLPVNTVFVGGVRNTANTIQMYLSQATESSSSVMAPNIDGDDVGIGHDIVDVAQDWCWEGMIEVVKIYNSALSLQKIKEFGFLAAGWASNNGGVTRAKSSGVYSFHQGVVTDTVYYNTALTAGIWSVSVDVDGNSGGETYRILTSKNAVNWEDMKSGTAPASSTTITVTKSGLGYIGLAVSSAADTVYFDNLTVTLQSAPTSPFKQHSNYNKFKHW